MRSGAAGRGGFISFVGKSAMSSVAWVREGEGAGQGPHRWEVRRFRCVGHLTAEPGAVTSTEARIGVERPVTCQGGHV